MSFINTQPYELLAEYEAQEFMERLRAAGDNHLKTIMGRLPGMLHELIHDTLQEGMTFGDLERQPEINKPAEPMEAYNLGYQHGQEANQA